MSNSIADHYLPGSVKRSFIHEWAVRGLVFVLGIYQKILAFAIPRNNCRFYPTCSNYAITAIELHGVFRGTFLAIKRLLRCHPLNAGGFDPVPGDTSFD
jgi:putative membrane protein insertion efficiency factor